MKTTAAVLATTAGLVVSGASAATTYQLASMYSDNACKTPSVVAIMASTVDSCQTIQCTSKAQTSCADSVDTALASAFGNTPYFVMSTFNDKDCKTPVGASAIAADGKCQATAATSYVVSADSSGAITCTTFSDVKCAAKVTSMNISAADATGSCMSSQVGGMTFKYLKPSISGNVSEPRKPTDNGNATVPTKAGGSSTGSMASAGSKSSTTPKSGASAATTYQLGGFYSDDACKTPSVVTILASTADTCQAMKCSSKMQTSCADSLDKALASAFASTPYLSMSTFSDKDCKTALSSIAIAADGKCQGNDAGTYIVSVDSKGVVSYTMFSDAKCAAKVTSIHISAADATGSCMGSAAGGTMYKYSKASGPSPTPTSDAMTVTLGSMLTAASVTATAMAVSAYLW